MEFTARGARGSAAVWVISCIAAALLAARYIPFDEAMHERAHTLGVWFLGLCVVLYAGIEVYSAWCAARSGADEPERRADKEEDHGNRG